MGHKVLLVDDEMHITMIVARKLRSLGYEVETADNGADAFDKAREFEPDIVVTDYQMPRVSGDQFARNLFADATTAAIPVIMLTARGFLLNDQLQAETSIRRILAKPFSVTEVSSLISEVLSGSEQAGRAA